MINLGRTLDNKSFGRGLEERKLLLDEGTDDDELNIFL